MKKEKYFLWVLFAFAVFLCGEVFAQYSENDSSIEVAKGGEFTISLESNRTTGYEWQLTRPTEESMILFLSTEYVSGDPALIGSGGKEVWSFRAIGAGRSQIIMKYVRPWEADKEPAKKTEYSIIVTNTENNRGE